MSTFWGKHFLIDLRDCEIDKITSRSNIEAFAKAVVERIKMKAHGEPVIEHFATHDPSKGGFTLCQMIETSLIDGHFVDATGEAFISIHSCAEFDTLEVAGAAVEFFQPKTILPHPVVYRGDWKGEWNERHS